MLQKRLLKNNLKYSVINAGISGDTTSGGLSRLPKLIDKHQPSFLILELGGNDGLRGTSLKAVRKNMRGMIDIAQNNNITVVLMGVQLPPNYGEIYTRSFQDIFSSLASEYDLVLIQGTLKQMITDNLMQPDGIHPNVEGHIEIEKIAKKIGEYNNKLGIENPYLLIGPGRWGSSDPWLGIPVNWEQIANAKSIVEIGIDKLNPDPSFGSHFFQNLTSLRIGYFTINHKNYKTSIDWEWLKKQNHIYKSKYVNVVTLEKPLMIQIDGKNGNGLIIKHKKINEIMNENEASGI